MDEQLVEWIESNASNLAVKDELILRDNLKKLEEKFRVEFEGLSSSSSSSKQDDQKKQLQDKFWLHLARLSVKLENVELSLVVAAKLKLSQLALLLRSTLQQYQAISGSELLATEEKTDPRERLALSYVASYFHLDENLTTLSSSLDSSQLKANCLFDCEQMVNLYIDCGDWPKAFELIETRYDHNKRQLSLEKQLIYYKLANHCEIDENFPEALINFEKSGTQGCHSPRVIIKQFLESSYKELEKYCIASDDTNTGLKTIWTDYSLAYNAIFHQQSSSHRTSLIPEAKLENLESDERMIDDTRSTIEQESGSGFFSLNLDAAEEMILALLPEKMSEFLRDPRPDKWANKRRLESMISIGSSLDLNIKSQLVELARRFCHQSNQILKACGLYLCLNQVDTFLHLVGRYFTEQQQQHHASNGFSLQCQFSSSDRLAIKLMEFVQNNSDSKQFKRNSAMTKRNYCSASLTENQSLLFNACLKLGLIDEALRVFSMNPNVVSEQALGHAIEHLETLIEEKHSGSLDQIDPELQGSTLLTIYKTLLGSQILSTQMINILILLITIFLLKLDDEKNSLRAQQQQQQQQDTLTHETSSINKLKSIRTLEVMFEQLSGCFNELNFSTPDSLIRSATSLVSAVKEKLDLISDSEIIRNGFKQLVDSISGRCMIEGRYKSAAMLYSQIEDNVSAIKSLMRMGDVDVVINYSLLVKDITVNRITINYLRHLGVDQSIIEDFIAKTKPATQAPPL